MTIQDILGKVRKGEQLTDEDKTFLDGYDPQKEIDTASAAARRKAETAAKEAIAKATAAEAALKELQEKANDQTKDNELAKMQKQIAKLEALNAAAEAKNKAHARLDAIRTAAKAAGIVAADGVNGSLFERLLDLSVGDTDVTDQDALKTVLDQFKSENPAMIAAAVKGGTGTKGNPLGAGKLGGVNPWKEGSINLTEQMRLAKEHPEQAVALAAECGVKLNINGDNPTLG